MAGISAWHSARSQEVLFPPASGGCPPSILFRSVCSNLEFNSTTRLTSGRFCPDTSIRVSYLGTTLSGLIAGVDLNELAPSDTPFGTTIGDGVTPCDPLNNGDCDYSPADIARQPFPGYGDFMLSYGNFGHGRSNAFQTQLEKRYSHGLMLNISYTYLDQKSTGLDTGNSSLGGIAYNAFDPNHDTGRNRSFPKTASWPTEFTTCRWVEGRKFGSSFSTWADAIVGGWQTTLKCSQRAGPDSLRSGFATTAVCGAREYRGRPL